jgi:hypothetical protein
VGRARAYMSAHYAHTHTHTGTHTQRSAQLTMFARSTDAFASSSRVTTPEWPLKAACHRGVRPSCAHTHTHTRWRGACQWGAHVQICLHTMHTRTRTGTHTQQSALSPTQHPAHVVCLVHRRACVQQQGHHARMAVEGSPDQRRGPDLRMCAHPPTHQARGHVIGVHVHAMPCLCAQRHTKRGQRPEDTHTKSDRHAVVHTRSHTHTCVASAIQTQTITPTRQTSSGHRRRMPCPPPLQIQCRSPRQPR